MHFQYTRIKMKIALRDGAIPLICALIIVSGLIPGCAPVISEGTLKLAKGEVRFEDVLEDPGRYTGSTVVLGGTILRAENLEDRTIVEVLQQRLGWRLKPVDPDGTKGRFLVSFSGFRDPAVYAAGRRITVAGRVAGFETRMLGPIPYRYPVIEPIEHYLWSEPCDGEPSLIIGVGVSHGF